jgi:hypothetical protein
MNSLGAKILVVIPLWLSLVFFATIAATITPKNRLKRQTPRRKRIFDLFYDYKPLTKNMKQHEHDVTLYESESRAFESPWARQ